MATLAALAAACGGATQPAVSVPAELRDGERLFQRACMSCHGPAAVGTDLGPPLVDPMYAPDKVPDEAFVRAALFGAKAKSWQLGDMPPTAGVTDPDVRRIAAYVRFLQRQAAVRATPGP